VAVRGPGGDRTRCTPTSRTTGPRSPPSTASWPSSPTRRSWS
jgi:hypothetical protein